MVLRDARSFRRLKTQDRLEPPVRLVSDLHRHTFKISRGSQKQLELRTFLTRLIEIFKARERKVIVGANVFTGFITQEKAESFRLGTPGDLRKRNLMEVAIIEIAERYRGQSPVAPRRRPPA